MLDILEIRHVAPAPDMNLSFAPRVNVITGDNGLGKTFVLDVAWWVLTQSWAGLPVVPGQGGPEPTIRARLRRPAEHTEWRYHYPDQKWKATNGQLAAPGIIVYIRVDGGFSIWDPARNRGLESELGSAGAAPAAFHFWPNEVWDGLNGRTVLCNGLIRDWVTWQYRGSKSFELLRKVMETLSSAPEEKVRIADPVRVSIADAREIPSIVLPWGTVPLIHASAGIRRVAALAYLLVWTWTEHVAAAAARREQPATQMMVLFDEVEAHLHPRWQRLLLPAVQLIGHLLSDELAIQLVATTHAPLVLASLEPWFDLDQDGLILFELNDRQIQVTQPEFKACGDVSAWLTSEAFGLPRPDPVRPSR